MSSDNPGYRKNGRLCQPPPDKCRTPLQKWVSEKGMSARDFSKLVDLNPTYSAYIISGNRRPSVDLAKKIEKVTEGAIKAIDLLELNS